MNLITTTLKAVLFITLIAVCINAQSPTEKAMDDLNSAMSSTEGKTTFLTAIVVIDGKTYTANSLHEFNVLKSTAMMCNTLKRAKANNQIDSTQYAEKTAAIMTYSKAVRN